MTPTEIRTAVRSLQAQGHSLREISRLLALSRNTVRRILREPGRSRWRSGALRRGDTGQAEGRLRTGPRQRGPGARIAGRRWSRGALQHLDPLGQGGRAARPAAARRRIRLRARPGDAARHLAASGDVRARPTSPSPLQCAGLVLAYSRRLFIQYYPRFTRFEAKAFLLEAARFMAGVCPVCIIDNTSVLLAAGAGADAVIAPEMAGLRPHPGLPVPRAPGGKPGPQRPDRASLRLCRDEFPGRPQLRRFRRPQPPGARLVPRRRQPQAQAGARHVARSRLSSSSSHTSCRCPTRCRRSTSCWNASSICTAMSRSTPTAIPSPSVTSANRSPSTKLPAEIHVCRKDTTIAVHRRLIGQRDARNILPGHHTIPVRQGRGTAAEEALLSGHHPSLDRYAAALRQRGNGGQPAGPPPADRDEAHLPGRSVHRRHRTGLAVRPVRPRPPGRPHPQTGRRRLLRAGRRGGRRCVTSCAP